MRVATVLVLLSLLSACVLAIEFHPHHRVLKRFQPADWTAEPQANSVKALTHQELSSIYGFPWTSTGGAGKTVAIVIAYGSSTTEADLATFVSHNTYLPACTTANGCYKRVNQTGGTKYPADDDGWGTEAALDTQAIHAIAPGAKKLLVVANSNSDADLFQAVKYAAQNAQYVSMSWGGDEDSSITSWESTFAAFPNVTFAASTGDAATDISYPSTSAYIVAVGGTTVTTTAAYALSAEGGWSSGGGGCSKYIAVPSAQSSFSEYAAQSCKQKRSVPDLAYDADPNSGVVVYSGTDAYQVGGTSLSAPIFSARAALSGGKVTVATVYGSTLKFRDITTGGTTLNKAKTGLDKSTGRGAWVN